MVAPEQTASQFADSSTLMCSFWQVAMAGTAFESAEFFETCAMLITFICLGKYLECAAKGKTSAAIAALMGLAPPTALLLTLDVDGKVNFGGKQHRQI
jgi:P-type Cu+ transporter